MFQNVVTFNLHQSGPLPPSDALAYQYILAAAGVYLRAIYQALFLTQREEPVDAVNWMLGMNRKHLHSELVEQHVLLLGGENDAFQPPKLLHSQEQVLVNARSVTTRIFTKEGHADQHCQMGNLGLVLEVMVDWLDKTSASSGERLAKQLESR